MGTTQDLQRWQRVLLPVVIAAILVSGFVGCGLIRQAREANQTASHSHAERMIEADALLVAMYTRSADARGYLLSGDPILAEHRNAAREVITRQLDKLRAYRVDPVMLGDIDALMTRLDSASDRAAAAYATSPDEARRIWDQESKPVQEQLSRILGDLGSAERAAFTAARDRAADAFERSNVLLAVLLLVVATLVTLMFYGYARATRALVAQIAAEQEQTTFRLLEQVPVGIFVLNAKGKPHYANQHAQKLLGRGIVSTSPDNLPDTYQAYEAGTDRLYPADRLPVVRALAGEVTECSDIEIHHADEVVPLHVVGAPVHDSRGELLYAVAGFQDVRELQRFAMRDSLTGLANRAAITQIYNRERAVSSRAGRSFAIGLIDLDKFKSVNDTHGHAAGDEVLRRTAASLVGSLRRSDAVGRWGGEEIVVLLPATDEQGAWRALEHALIDVRKLTFTGKDEQTFHVTFSAGAVIAGASESLDEVIARADTLLYKAKSKGRNRVEIQP
ncbi:MAG TPA: diguanylate cyclase [Kofleriaceae bacterium]|nr:diguanylate cyclase [Kofleriaceae bacterium]